MLIIRPKTLVRWHRAGLRRYWRWKSRSAGGRPQVDAELRALIWRMSVDNRLWGAPHIHGDAQARLCGGSVDRREWDGPAVLPPPTTRRVGWGLEEHEEDTPCPAKQTLQSHAPLVSIPVRTRCI